MKDANGNPTAEIIVANPYFRTPTAKHLLMPNVNRHFHGLSNILLSSYKKCEDFGTLIFLAGILPDVASDWLGNKIYL